MATLLPSYSQCATRMQAGERRFAQRLEELLEDDYLCWYDIPVGRRQRYADFIVLHPRRGLLFLEVKDWKLESLQAIDKVSATILTPAGRKVVSNPLEQARQCMYVLIDRLKLDRQLVHGEGRYQGNLVCPHGFGVVLSSITRRQFDGTDLGEVIPAHQVICRDEMTGQVDSEAFQARLWGMFNVQFGHVLTLPQMNRLRWHLFPELRIGEPGQLGFTLPEPEVALDAALPDFMRVMDLQQEQLARSLGSGHRVIHGVAGSGKTMILGYRCLQLASVLSKPILVLCYNITLAARLRAMMVERGLGGKVNVYHFHDWCGEQLKRYHVPRPDQGEEYFERLVAAVVDGVAKGGIPSGQYGAVMIDEGHDFEPDWLRLISAMIDPESDSLLLLYDDAQSIYPDRRGLRFTLSSVGIKAVGRTTILKVNYRNTDEILHFAYRFAARYLNPAEADDDGIPLVEPASAGRNGPPPAVRTFESFRHETLYIARLLARLRAERGTPWRDICVIYRAHWMGEELSATLTAAGVPVQWLHDGRSKKAFRHEDDSVRLMTMHSSKGLEFPVVVVAGAGFLPSESQSPVEEAKLLYVAMTRSTERLLVTAHRETEWIRQLKEAGAGAAGEGG